MQRYQQRSCISVFCIVYFVFCILFFLSFRICIELRHGKTLIRVSTSMTPIFCFMYLWYSLVTKLKGWILTGTFITMITVKMMIMITTVVIVVTIIVTMITIKIMTVIHLRCRHVCLREHICEKFLQDRRCENGKRQKNHFPVLSASAQILQIRMMCNLYWTPTGYLIFITNASYEHLVLCTSVHLVHLTILTSQR